MPANGCKGDAADPAAGDVPIIRHPDVRRNLMKMRALTEATRALGCYVASQLDIARKHPDTEVRNSAQQRVDLLVPVVKAWSTDCGVEIASLGVQVHGGAGLYRGNGRSAALSRLPHHADLRGHERDSGPRSCRAQDHARPGRGTEQVHSRNP